MNKQDYIRSVLFLSFLIYFAQGVIYSQGSIIAQAALGLIYLISGNYFVKTLLQKKNKSFFFKIWTALLILNIVGFVFTADYTKHLGMFKGVLMSLLTFYPFYYWAQNGNLKRKHLVQFFVVMLPLTIGIFYFNRNAILTEATSDNIEVVNNIAYSFVGLIPFVFLIQQKRLLSIFAIGVLTFFIIQGAKRGAIMVGALGLLSFIYYQMRTVEKKHRFRGYLIIAISIIGLSYFAYDMLLSNEFLMKRLESIGEGQSSGRDIIYANIFNGWYNSDSIMHYIFGFGFAGSMLVSGSGHFAHNDWLELLSNFGLIGFFLYLSLFYSAYMTLRKSKWTIDKKLLFGTIMSMWFLTTLFSMGYTSMGGYVNAMLIGYLMGTPTKDLI
jgi:hypothetical protein